MTCCLNSACHNPPHPDGVKFCSHCGVGLVVLRNRYRPIKTLGGGGFGKTYLAEDVDKLNEHCVIKQFAPQVQGTASLNKATELFEQEAKRLQHLGKHPQIPTLLAYFNEDNRLYLVQEFIEGDNLFKELQQQGKFNEQQVRKLLLDLLDILKTVHQQQIIHRDIKPENIIKRSDGKLVLIDFGASKQLTATVMTQVGTTIGSFGYAPLEQMQGGEAYPASDLYSVGATCFHLLSGIHPWELWKRQGYGWVGNWRQHLQQPVSQQLGRILDLTFPVKCLLQAASPHRGRVILTNLATVPEYQWVFYFDVLSSRQDGQQLQQPSEVLVLWEVWGT
jgi:serine/threonine protein kinase